MTYRAIENSRNSLTPRFVTPYTLCMDTTQQKSTRQLLDKIPTVQCLYRHKLNGTYYGIKKHSGKRKEHSLQTADRKIAERKLAEWTKGLDKIDSTAETMTLIQLLDKFVAGRQGKSESTIATDASIIARFKEQWKHGLDIRVSRIRPSFLDEWLASNEGRLKHASYNRYSGFLKHLFTIAVKDRAIIESPFELVKTRWKKPQKPRRIVPTQEQFEAIVNEIRTQRLNAEAKDSADFVEFLGLAGLGQAEASVLTWGDIDWTAGVMHIKRQKTQQRFPVPIYAHLKPMLERMLAEYPSQPSSNTKVFKILDARKALVAACKRLEYHPFTQRNIRAALIRRLWQSGVDVKLISKWQGHQDGGRLILNTYTEVFGANDAEYIKTELAKVK
jgi:integrase